MANIAASVGGMLGAGVRGIMDMADGLMHIGEADPMEVMAGGEAEDGGEGTVAGTRGRPRTDSDEATLDASREEEGGGGGSSTGLVPMPAGRPQPRRSPSQSDSASQSSSLSVPASNLSTSISNLSLRQSALIQTIDVPSGWIHLQNTYIDVAGSDRTVRSFGIRCLVDEEVEVEVASDLGEQVVFWRGEDEKDLSSAASYSTTSSASNSTGTTSLTLTVPAQSAVTVYLAFIPSKHHSASPPIPQSPMMSDGGFTPRVLPQLQRGTVTALPLDPSSASGTEHETASVSAGSSQSVAGSFKAPSSVGAAGRRTEPNYRAFSLHGCITLRASALASSTPRHEAASGSATGSAGSTMQVLNLPFFATVCKSHFTAALLDAGTGLASNAHQGSGQMVIDFGSECVVGQEYHRDILLVNRSEIELVWMTAVVNSRYKDQAWFSLRDLDSENVFGSGVDTSSQPVPLPSLSSRHLRLTLRIREPVIDFAFDFVISNVNQSGNLVTCRAIGSGQAEGGDNALKILSGMNLDFGQVIDGMWAKALITCKNAGDKTLDVRFSSSASGGAAQAEEVCFRLAGVAGDDMDEDIVLDPRASSAKRILGGGASAGSTAQGQTHDTHALLAAPPRSSARSVERERGRMTSSPLRSRPTSPNGSRYSEPHHASTSQTAAYDTESQASSLSYPHSHTLSSTAYNQGHSLRDPSLPPSRPLSRVASRSSSYRYAHTDATESDDDEVPFFGGPDAYPHSTALLGVGGGTSYSAQSYTSAGSMAPPPPPSNASSAGSVGTGTSSMPDAMGMGVYDRTIPNQIEELAMRPGTEYRVWVLYRPRRDTINTQIVAGQLRTNSFKVYLDATASRGGSGGAPNGAAGGNKTPASTGQSVASANRRTIHCAAESCTSLIRVSTSIASGNSGVQHPGQSGITELDEHGNAIPHTTTVAETSATPRIDFGEVTVGASKSATIRIENLSHLSAKVEIAAISKVLSTNRNVIVIPPRESVEEKVEFFPRRINERYEKQVFVRNLLNRANDQLVEIRSRNVDVNNVTLHSHLYRILTPNGANFLDFGSVVINSPTVRTVQIENLTLAPLMLSLLASSTEDVEVYVKLSESNEMSKTRATELSAPGTARPVAYADEHDVLERVTSPPNGTGDLKERFMETLRELEAGPVPADKGKGAKGKTKAESSTQPAKKGTVNGNTHGEGLHKPHSKAAAAHHHQHGRAHASKPVEADGAKASVGAAVAAALRKGGRGRPVQLYGNAVVFKDRSLLDHHEHLDLAAGPPIAAHRVSPRSKKSALLESIVSEDKTQLSGRNSKSVKLDFAAGAKANGAVGKVKRRKAHGEKKEDKQKEGDDSADNEGSTNGKEAEQDGDGITESMVLTPKPKAKTSTSRAPLPTLANIISSLAPAVGTSDFASTGTAKQGPSTPDGGKSPALTGKRRESGLLKQEMFSAADVSKMSVDELLVALEQHDARRPTFNRVASTSGGASLALDANASSTTASSSNSGANALTESLTLEEEEQFVRRHIALRKELANLISSGKLVPARQLTIPPKAMRQMIVILTPNGSIRPHVSTRPKRADSRLFINLLDFDRSYLSASTASTVDVNDLPVRELIMRSACVRSTLEVQQTSINFGNCEKGEVRSKTIVIQNKSDSIGLFRLRTSGSIASGDLKLGLGRYGVISAYGRKEFTNFSFTPSLFGKYEETIVVENVLDSYQDQTVYVKANVRKQPAFTLDPTTIDFGQVALAEAASSSANITSDSSQDSGKELQVVDVDLKNGVEGWDFVPPSPASVILTNVSKSERTFVITVELEKVPEVDDPESGDVSEKTVLVPFAEVHLSRDDTGAGTALSKAEEEEAEGMLQKLKIARRKGKADKVEKYEARLTELGVEYPKGTVADVGEDDEDKEGEADEGKKEKKGKGEKDGKKDKKDKKGKDDFAKEDSSEAGQSKKIDEGAPEGTVPSTAHSETGTDPDASSGPIPASSSGPPPTQPLATLNPCVTSLTVTLPASQKTKILIELRQSSDRPKSVEKAASRSRTMKASIKVHDRKNTDDTVNVAVLATLAGRVEELVPPSSTPTSDPAHLALMRHCIDLSYKCEVSPTAFCVGSTLFLPSTSAHYPTLSDRFPRFPSVASVSERSEAAAPSAATGLILGDGYSRQIPGNTHAEANALANFRTRYAQLQGGESSAPADDALQAGLSSSLPPIELVLKDVVCYATMEPCSVRTSGGPSCALELVRAGVKAVYLGVEEPPDFVKCEGVQILQDGGVEVHHLHGLEEECLKAARRGRD